MNASDTLGSTADPRPLQERSGGDRRRRPTPLFSRYLLIGKRRRGRRQGERTRIYADRPSSWVAAAFLVVMTLSIADAYTTLNLLAAGGEEANPVMAAALSFGDDVFVGVKLLLTFLGVSLLCLHQHWPLARTGLWSALAGYVALHAYVAVQAWMLPLGR